MVKFNYALNSEDYTWKNALLWGNFKGHCAKVKEGALGDKVVHVLIASTQLFPIISQISSILEKAIVDNLSKPISKKISKNVSKKNVPPTIQPAQLKEIVIPLTSHKKFSSVFSNELFPLNIKNRAEFLAKARAEGLPNEPLIISFSPFVPEDFVSHLLDNKKHTAIGVKYEAGKGDKITNMEGALHTFVTPIVPITMTGDYAYKGHHTIVPFKKKGRPVVLSAAIQSDFENCEVALKLIKPTDKPIQGKALPEGFKPLDQSTERDQQKFEQQLPQYEATLQAHMIYHLTRNKYLPTLSEAKKSALEYPDAIQLLEKLINDQTQEVDLTQELSGKFMNVNSHVISLEVLFNLYIHQVCNEFTVLEAALTQGYVYEIDPPSIFAKEIGGAKNVNLLNRLQILAFKHLRKQSTFGNLKIIGFNDYMDKGAISLLKQVFPDKHVCAKSELYNDSGYYSVLENYAAVRHNNSDAFGQNIATEGETSMDGVIGVNSDAAWQLRPRRDRLLV